jgi:hypothetical protein
MNGQYGRITDKMTQLGIECVSHEPIVVLVTDSEGEQERVECKSLNDLETWLDEQLVADKFDRGLAVGQQMFWNNEAGVQWATHSMFKTST